MKPKKNFFIVAMLLVTSLCVATGLVSILLNQTIPTQSKNSSILSATELSILKEANNLKENLGDKVWPGFGNLTIPVVLFNESTAFLSGSTQPDSGWIRVPNKETQGQKWNLYSETLVNGVPIYSQIVEDPGNNIGAFTVKVSNQYTASMTTYEWSRILMVNYLKEDLPAGLKQGFPYWFFPFRLYTIDWHLMAIMHESFHAYQGSIVPDRLDQAELLQREMDNQYFWEENGASNLWKEEATILQAALKADNQIDQKALVEQFLNHRKERRITTKLTESMIQYEQEREWLEGLAKYFELSVWKTASSDSSYEPIKELSNEANFQAYLTYPSRWKQELQTLVTQSSRPDETKFYYSGMAQAMLLDSMMPDWKTQIFQPGTTLEQLLQKAVN